MEQGQPGIPPDTKVQEDAQTSDEATLARAVQGDQEAFGKLYERYVNRIYSYIFYRTGNHHDAEDLTARVFFRAIRNITNYQERGLPFSAWLYRIAHNLVANWHRDRSRRPEIVLDESLSLYPSTEHPELMILKSEESDRLLTLLRNQPQDRQQLLILKFVDHMSNAEIGLIMGKTEGAIKSLYHRTLITLREDLKDLGGI
jgi:RNA polymerase sigma-70 factor (ECF subfamily)